MSKLTRIIILISVFNFLLLNPGLLAQEVPHPVSNTGVYDFLDELANKQIITINSVIKPYSRLFISQRLKEAEGKREQLTSRQQKELDFYMKDFGKEIYMGKDWKRRLDLLYYKDSLFSLTVNPILGAEMFSNSSGKASYWRNGFDARGYIGKWGFYASLRDNHEDPLLGKPEYLTKREGGHLKGTTDWSEMQGGVTYAWKWGSAGLVKEKNQWGNNYNGANILGGHNPTFVQIQLHISPVKWFDFHYIHGWLNSMVIDSADSYWVVNSYGTDYREVYHKKFIAANMFTFTPFKNLNISAGNSIVYTGENAHPAYLIPVFFYKSVDHTYTSGIDNMNSQMFFDVSSRQIKGLHLYGTLFIDELSVDRFSMDDQWNFFSWKAGFRLTDFPVRNLSLTTEFTYTYPLTFQHYVPTTTFENVGYNMGHYLKDNAREWYVGLDYRPIRAMNINLFFSDAIRGPDYTALGTNRVGNPPLVSVEWHNTSWGGRASYQILNDLYTWVSYVSSDISGEQDWSPEYFYGQKKTVNFGVTVGF
jgi:hypothetical protein